MKMFAKDTKTGMYVKLNIEGVREDKEAPMWIMVEDPFEATHDPGYVMGEDLTMHMMMFLKEEYGVGSISLVNANDELPRVSEIEEVQQDDPHLPLKYIMAARGPKDDDVQIKHEGVIYVGAGAPGFVAALKAASQTGEMVLVDIAQKDKEERDREARRDQQVTDGVLVIGGRTLGKSRRIGLGLAALEAAAIASMPFKDDFLIDEPPWSPQDFLGTKNIAPKKKGRSPKDYVPHHRMNRKGKGGYRGR